MEDGGAAPGRASVDAGAAPAVVERRDAAGGDAPAPDAATGAEPVDAAVTPEPGVAADWCYTWAGEQTLQGVLQPQHVMIGTGGEPRVTGVEVQIVDRFTFGGGGFVSLGSFVQRLTADGAVVGPEPLLERDMAAMAAAPLPDDGVLLAGQPAAYAVSLGDGGHSMAWLDASGAATRRDLSAGAGVIALAADADGLGYGLLSIGGEYVSGFGPRGSELRSWGADAEERWAYSAGSASFALALSPDAAHLAVLGLAMAGSLEDPVGPVPFLELIASDAPGERTQVVREELVDAGFVDGHFDAAGALYAVGFARTGSFGEHFVERFDQDGEPLWAAAYPLGNVAAGGAPVAAAVGPGGLLIAAVPDAPPADGVEQDVRLLALTPGGEPAWEAPMRFDSGQSDWPLDLAVGPDGAIYLLLRRPDDYQLCRLSPP